MRGSLLPVLLLSTLVLPPLHAAAQANAPLAPYAFEASLDAEPEVGATVRLSVRVEARSALAATYVLETPPWIEVEGDRAWPVDLEAGESAERAWRLDVTEGGFWRASLSEGGASATPVGGCCVFAWSTVDRGIWSMDAVGALPAESSVGFHPSYRALDAERAELVVRVSPQDKRYAGQELVFQVLGEGSDEQRAPADAPHEFHHALPLADGAGTLVTPSASVRVTFAGGTGAPEVVSVSQHVACANIQLQREGDEVREVARTGCDAAAAPARHGDDAPVLPVPLPGSGALLAVTLSVALALSALNAYPRRPV